MAELSHDQIRERAYFLWQQDGQPEGVNDWHYWLLAEQQIRTECAPEPVTEATPAAPAPADPASARPAPRRKTAAASEAAAPAKKAKKTPAADTAAAADPAPAKKAPAKRRSPAKPGKA